jgi:hypothetical protein
MLQNANGSTGMHVCSVTCTTTDVCARWEDVPGPPIILCQETCTDGARAGLCGVAQGQPPPNPPRFMCTCPTSTRQCRQYRTDVSQFTGWRAVF